MQSRGKINRTHLICRKQIAERNGTHISLAIADTFMEQVKQYSTSSLLQGMNLRVDDAMPNGHTFLHVMTCSQT